MILPQARKDKSAKNQKRIRENLKILLISHLSRNQWRMARFKVVISVFDILDWQVNDKVYSYLKNQRILKQKYENKKINWFKYQFKKFINWFNFNFRSK